MILDKKHCELDCRFVVGLAVKSKMFSDKIVNITNRLNNSNVNYLNFPDVFSGKIEKPSREQTEKAVAFSSDPSDFKVSFSMANNFWKDIEFGEYQCINFKAYFKHTKDTDKCELFYIWVKTIPPTNTFTITLYFDVIVDPKTAIMKFDFKNMDFKT